MNVPVWWVWVSAIYFIVSVVWSVALIGLGIVLVKKVLPIISESRARVEQASTSVKAVMARATSTVETVQGGTKRLLGDAKSTGGQLTRQARVAGATISGVMVAVRVVNFVRKFT